MLGRTGALGALIGTLFLVFGVSGASAVTYGPEFPIIGGASSSKLKGLAVDSAGDLFIAGFGGAAASWRS